MALRPPSSTFDLGPLSLEELHLVRLFRRVPALVRDRVLGMLTAVIESLAVVPAALLVLCGWCLDL